MFMAEQFMGQICAAATDYNHNLMSGCVILTWCIPFKHSFFMDFSIQGGLRLETAPSHLLFSLVIW